jgi:hypothetical protein
MGRSRQLPPLGASELQVLPSATPLFFNTQVIRQKFNSESSLHIMQQPIWLLLKLRLNDIFLLRGIGFLATIDEQSLQCKKTFMQTYYRIFILFMPIFAVRVSCFAKIKRGTNEAPGILRFCQVQEEKFF